MTKKRAGTLLAAFAASLALLLALACFAPLTALAAAPPVLGSAVDPNSDPGDDLGDYVAEGIEIVSYEIRQGDGVVPSVITKGMSFSLFMRVRDTRRGVGDSYKPKANLNTSSFTTDGAVYPLVTKHKATDGAYFTLDFLLTYTGEGNLFQCDVYYHNNKSVPVQPLTLTLNQCQPYTEEPDSSDSSDEPTRNTGFVLKGASVGGPNVTAGTAFTLDTEIMSTNGTYAVENVSISLILPKEISLATGQSVSYVGRVGPNQTIPVAFDLLASAVAEEGSYTISINVSGVNAQDGSPVSADMDVTIPLAQPERFEISNATVPDYLTAGMDDGSGYSNISLLNKGKGVISNVTVYVEGEGLSTDMGRQFVGNINPGSESNADFNIIASTAGDIDAAVVVEYENARGDVKTLRHEFTLTVAEGGGWDDGGMIDPYPIEPMPEEPEGMPMWVWIVVAVVVVVAIIVIIVVVRKRKARKAAAELEDDADEDI